MFPRELAEFTFQDDAAGTDGSIAARASAVDAHGRVAVLGAARPGLLIALARLGIEVVAADPSRRTLARARDEIRAAGVEQNVTLFAADPRDVVFPGGAGLALVTSMVWRALVPRAGREEMLQCLDRALEGGKTALCVDLERIPPPPQGHEGPELLRRDEEHRAWWLERNADRGLVTVRCEPAEGAAIELELADVTLESCVEEVARAGFVVECSCDADTGAELDANSSRLWLVARPGGLPGT